MAIVNFNADIEEIVGKLAGSVFQDSYGGNQLRTRVSPRNPQTNYQQLRRGEFAFITQQWRELTDAQRSSFTDNAPTGMSAINFFISCNVNLSLINQNIISSFISSAAPIIFPMKIDALTVDSFFISGSGEITTIPPDSHLLIFATAEKAPSKIFTNPSQFSPIAAFPPEYDFSVSTDISPEWVNHYGQMTKDKRICIRAALITDSNGLRSDSPVVCATETPASDFFVIDSEENVLSDDSAMIIYQ